MTSSILQKETLEHIYNVTIKMILINSFFFSEDSALEKELVIISQSPLLQQTTYVSITYYTKLLVQIIPKEVLLREIDISSAIVSYITNNSISNIVVGASSHNAFFKSLSILMLNDIISTLVVYEY